jgi:tubulin polyglutamylase TTLL6/13
MYKFILNYCLDTQYDVIKEAAEELGWKLTEYDNEEFDVFWSDLPCGTEKLSHMRNYQKLNHFPSMYQICRKNLLAKNLKKMERRYPIDYKITPKTWLLPYEYNELKAYITKKKVVSMIVKPEASAQGRGIFITRRLEDISPTEHYVVQRYMRSPYLIDDFKFDLRIYVLITSCDPLKIFIYKEGMVRFATEEWDIESGTNYDNLFMHLTNYAINKDNGIIISDDPHEDIGHKRLLSTVMDVCLKCIIIYSG